MRQERARLHLAGTLVVAFGALLAVYSPVLARSSGETGPLADSSVFVHADGELYAIDVPVASVAEALSAAGIALKESDGVVVNGHFLEHDASFGAGGSEPPAVVLDVRRAVTFTLVEDGSPRTVRSSRPTVGEAIALLGVETGPADIVEPDPSTALVAGQRVSVRYARKLAVSLPGDYVELLTHEKTVGAALTAASVDLPDEYRLEPGAAEPVTPELEVAVIAIGEGTDVEEIPVAAAEVRVPDDSLPPGEERIVEGYDGTLYREYAVVYENGAEVSRELLSEWYDPEPADTVIYYSTQPTPTPPPTATPRPRYASGVEQWREVVCSYNWDCEWALRVIRCESNGNADSYNPSGPYIGLFQIYAGYGGDLYDPLYNIAAAYDIWLRNGTGPWPNC